MSTATLDRSVRDGKQAETAADARTPEPSGHLAGPGAPGEHGGLDDTEEARMDAAALRDLQAPLTEQYRDDPSSACVTMHVEAAFADPGITRTVQTWAGPARAGQPPPTGGDGGVA